MIRLPRSALRPAADSIVESPVAVRARHLTRRFGEGPAAVDALRGVDAELVSGSFTAIMGPSGSGKSTLMHILAGLDKPTSGYVELGGVRLGSLSQRELALLRRHGVGFIFQSFNLLPMLTAEENIALPVNIAGEKVDERWFDELVDAMGIRDRLGHLPSELSGGQQQRVAIARALIARPTVVFADEPTGNLDLASSGEILALLRRVVDEYGQTIVMVTHDASAAGFADRILFLADGQIVESATSLSVDEILDRIKALQAARP